MQYNAPAKLKSSRAWRTYTGGSQIDLIHGIKDSSDTQFPEEWIISTVLARNAGREGIEEGMCYLEDEPLVSLKDYIIYDPVSALGASHVQNVGSTTGVLMKIIDAAERLTVQVHPDKQQALSLFNSKFGKTECWHILGGRTIDGQKPSIYMGFKPGITREEWKRCFDEQDIPALLGHMHHIPVEPGQTYLIKGGVPHAIGQGCLLVEIQEPTDFTIRVERVTPKGLMIADQGCHQGLGFERMFDCFTYEGITEEEAFRRWRIPSSIIEQSPGFVRRGIVGYDSTPCFRLERFETTTQCEIASDGEFCGLYFLSGTGVLQCNGRRYSVSAGDQFFVPAASDQYSIKSDSGKTLSFFKFFGPQNHGADQT